MPSEFVSPWPAIGRELDVVYNKEFFFWQSYDRDDYLDLLMPQKQWNGKDGTVDVTEGKFFGTKAHSIFIAQKPYGWRNVSGNTWTFDWDNPTSAYSLMIEEHVSRWDRLKLRFPYFQCSIYVDLYTANEIQRRHPQSDMPRMMNKTATKIEETCNKMTGFNYLGKITSQQPSSFFQPSYNGFFTPTAYKLS